MDSTLYTAASGMIARQRDLEVTANNLANAATDGFRPEMTFYEVWRLVGGSSGQTRESAANSGVYVPTTYTGERQGALHVTGNRLDLALEGDAWLVVGTPRGERYTRGGPLKMDAGGTLVTNDGLPVLGAGGPLRVSGGTLEIGADGRVLVDGEERGALRVVQAPPGAAVKEGAGLYRLEQAASVAPAGPEIQVRQGHLEAPAVNAVEEMIRLIAAQRAFEQHARTVSLIMNDIDKKAVNDITQP